MNILYLVIFFLFGLIMGSIYTMIGLRLPNEDEKLFSKSHCDICYHKLTFIEKIPIISYLFLKGRCSYCHKKIDIKNLFMEIITGILFVLSYYVFGISIDLFIALGVVSVLVIVSVSDLVYMIIPDELLIFFSGYFIIFQYFKSGLIGALEHVFIGLFLFFIMYTIMIVGEKLFQRESLGGGDVKMMFLFGLVLDPLVGSLTIFLGSILALPMSLFIYYKYKTKEIPFGPFLLLAFAILYFMGIDSNYIINLLSI